MSFLKFVGPSMIAHKDDFSQIEKMISSLGCDFMQGALKSLNTLYESYFLYTSRCSLL